MSVAVSTQIQQTTQTMLASQQIGYGGQAFGQAFAPYVITGDNGYMGSVALRYDLPVFNKVQLLQPEIFYDIGYMTLNHAPAGMPNNANARSFGIGLLVQALKNCQLNLTLAKPLTITNTTNVSKSWA
jgi:hemolysin activation/secretion protein